MEFLGLISMLDLKGLAMLAGEAFQYEVTQFTIAFVLAWKIVKRDTKNELKGMIEGHLLTVQEGLREIVAELKEVRTALTNVEAHHSTRLTSLEYVVSEMKVRMGRWDETTKQEEENERSANDSPRSESRERNY